MPDISQITLPDNNTYDIDAVTVNGHTVNTDVPSGAVFTDHYVTQFDTPTTSAYNYDYRVLFSYDDIDNQETLGVRKATNLKYNPYTGNLQTTKVNGYTPTGVWVGTQADYNLLTPDNNVTYFITDGQTAPTPNAGTIGYDNTGSGLSANTVQAAIDEVTAELSEWKDFQYNTEKAVGFTYVSGTKKTVYHQILLSDASSTTAWGAKMVNLPFTGSNVIKASFLVASSSNNKYGPYYVSASDMFRAGIETTNLMAQFGTSYPALPARVIADVYYTK